ncbi:DUF3618 domain-containing protein [Rhizobium sp. RM]|uniref:DUF3618 domain-containing protein n=1 Tax=Rhizobium sp. RM TaxID=2748079 RepID=UPI00110DFD85|nr:DUF3618 domain-containing protein [Rhizobium sp. RM]NWJ27600.1 DUF3618 domain-containing protein [Rhizobium sp. RM]TMV19950.1 DUF3618 domain-containing protein [Rhizobium sp. Td3]
MTKTRENLSSSEIEQEIAADRRRIEERLDAIQQRMSPGQLVDEILSYARSSGGGEYTSNLSAAVKNNPIPMALVGVGLAWLMAGPKNSPASYVAQQGGYPLAIVEGDIHRSGPVTTEGDKRYSYFADSAGRKYKALTDDAGRRAGHFIDESGKTFRGFVDTTGRHYHDLRDEAGKIFDEASGWVSHTWSNLAESALGAREGLSTASQNAAERGAHINEAILKHFKDQPLVGGALAFAVGAAIGAALPHSQAEDEILGGAADDVKDRVSTEAAKTLDKAGNLVSEVYNKAVSIADDVHDATRDRILKETPT